MMPIHLLVLSLDHSLLDSTPSKALIRQQQFAKYFSHLTILVLNYGQKLKSASFQNLDVIPVNALGKLDLLARSFSLARQIFKTQPYHLITCEDTLITARVGKWLKQKLHLPLNIQTNATKQANFLEKYIIKSNLGAADSTHSPVTIDLDPYFKPAHYRPSIKKFISLGDLNSAYKFAELIDGFSRITKAYPNSSLTIIGDGPDKSSLASHVINLGLNDRIFLVGKKSPKEIAALLHQHDIFVFTGQSMGWGEVFVQAFSSGLPVITSPVKEGEDLLQPNINCLVAAGTQSLVASLTNLLTHPEEVYRLAKNGQQWLAGNLESTLLPKHFASRLLDTIYAK